MSRRIAIEQLQFYRWCIVHTALDEWYAGEISVGGFMGNRLSVSLKELCEFKTIERELEPAQHRVTRRMKDYQLTFDECRIISHKKTSEAEEGESQILSITIRSREGDEVLLSNDPLDEELIRAIASSPDA